jgi:hypothetical protein
LKYKPCRPPEPFRQGSHIISEGSIVRSAQRGIAELVRLVGQVIFKSPGARFFKEPFVILAVDKCRQEQSGNKQKASFHKLGEELLQELG